MNKDLQSWNAASGQWDKVAQDGTYRTHLIVDALAKLLPNVSGLKALDAGCGNGFFSQWLKDRGAEVMGVDGSDELIKKAHTRYPSITFRVRDLMERTSFQDGEFDLILANMLLMHLSNAKAFFAEARRILKPGGSMVFSVLHPAFNQPTAKLYKSLWQKMTGAKPDSLAHDYYSHEKGRFESHMLSDLTHYHRTIGEYSDLLGAAGFSIERIVEPHALPKEFLQKYPKMEYAERLPRFIFFKCK